MPTTPNPPASFHVTALKASPNVVVILIDGLGFGTATIVRRRLTSQKPVAKGKIP